MMPETAEIMIKQPDDARKIMIKQPDDARKIMIKQPDDARTVMISCVAHFPFLHCVPVALPGTVLLPGQG